jgi:hypothetical protein
MLFVHVPPSSDLECAKTPRQMQCQCSLYTVSCHPPRAIYPPHYLNLSLTQPNPPKQQNNRRKEAQPNLPPHARLLRHPQHAIHGALEPIPRVLELVVHFLGEGGRVADFVADEVCQLDAC